MAAPPPDWNAFTDAAIRTFCRNHNLDIDTGQNTLKQDLIQFLVQHNITPQAVFATTFQHVVHQAPAPTPKVDIKQGTDESLIEFIRRFDCALELNAVPQAKQVALLQLSLLPIHAQHITDFDNNTKQSYALTKAALLELNHVNQYQYLHLFENTLKSSVQSFRAYAGKLLYYYRQYSNVSDADMTNVSTARVVHSVVLSRIMTQVPNFLQLQMKTYAIAHTFEEVLQELDLQMATFQAASPSTTPAVSTYTPRPRTTCPLHPYSPHSADQCRVAQGISPPVYRNPIQTYRPRQQFQNYHRFQPPTSGTFNRGPRPTTSYNTNPSNRPATYRPRLPATSECFHCGEMGHYAKACPRLGNG
jgi:hypothetical protein